MELVTLQGQKYPRRAPAAVNITEMNPYLWGEYWWYYDTRRNVFGPFASKWDAMMHTSWTEFRGAQPPRRKSLWQRLKDVLRRWSNGL